jgi:hypothetical protein
MCTSNVNVNKNQCDENLPCCKQGNKVFKTKIFSLDLQIFFPAILGNFFSSVYSALLGGISKR